jgi:hypothetical protein
MRSVNRLAGGLVTMLMLMTVPAVGAHDPQDVLPAVTPDANVERSAIPEIYRWDLEPLFESDAAWDAARLRLLSELPQLAQYEGRLAEPAALLASLELYFRLHSDANFVTLYANLRHATAQSDETANAMVQRSLAAMDELMRSAAFIRREVLTLPAEALEAAFAAEPGLSVHRPYLDNLRRRAGRLLGPEAERVLSLLGDNLWAEIDLNEIPSPLEDAFGALLTDIPWPQITDEEGKKSSSPCPTSRATAPRPTATSGAVRSRLSSAPSASSSTRSPRPSPASSSSTWHMPAPAATTARSRPISTRTASRPPFTTTWWPPSTPTCP